MIHFYREKIFFFLKKINVKKKFSRCRLYTVYSNYFKDVVYIYTLKTKIFYTVDSMNTWEMWSTVYCMYILETCGLYILERCSSYIVERCRLCIYTWNMLSILYMLKRCCLRIYLKDTGIVYSIYYICLKDVSIFSWKMK